MRQIKVNIYNHSDLLENESMKDKVLSNWNRTPDYEWWDFVYEDAQKAGLKITEFDLYRFKISYENYDSMQESINMILNNHGKDCDTFKMAESYQSERDSLVCKFSDGVNTDKVAEDYEIAFDDEVDELEKEYFKELSEEYLGLLTREFEYLTSDEAVMESIKCNDYEFDEDGDLV